VVIRATDYGGCLAEVSAKVTVTPVNDAPVIAPIPTIHVRFNESATLDLTPYISDVDDPVDSLTLTTSDARAAFSGPFLTLLYPAQSLGSNPWYLLALTLFASDGDLTANRTVAVNVSDNSPPRLLLPLPDVFRLEDMAPYTMVISAFFADAEDGAANLLYEVTAGPLGVNVTRLGVQVFLVLTQPADWFGEALVAVTATDSAQAYAAASFRVLVDPVNDAPTLAPLANYTAAVGTLSFLDLTPFVSDIDSPLSALSAATGSEDVSAYGLILLFAYPAGSPQEDAFAVTVTDGEGSATRTLRVTIQSGVSYYPSSPWVYLALAAVVGVGLAVMALTRKPHTFEDAFLLMRDGRLVAHKTRRKRADRDEDIFAGMIAAISDFVKDSFREEGEDLKKFESKGNRFLVERGQHTYLAAIYGGREPSWSSESLKAAIADVEERYPGLDGWSGDIEELAGIGAMVEAFVFARRYRRGTWQRFEVDSTESRKESAEEAPDEDEESPAEDEERDDT